MARYDVGIVGAGIAGLSLAWHLQRAGKRVLILEKSAQADGASVRNFGMIWVIGQPFGDLQNLAFRSRELWQEAADDLGFWIRSSGSLTLAYEPTELQVLTEYMKEGGDSHGRQMVSSEEIEQQFPFVRARGLLGGIHSPTEAGVDPREVVHKAAEGLSERGIDIRFDTMVIKIQSGQIETSDGEHFEIDKIIVCPGPNLFSLYPEACRKAGLYESRLQMMRLEKKSPEVSSLGIHLCAGLTLSHYANFRDCPSLPDLKEVHKKKWPVQMEKGIHVLVAEHADGSLTVGDSHAYGRNLSAYRDESTDEAILEAMDEFLPRDDYRVIQRWDGTYNTHASAPYWWEELGDNIWGLNLFGTGMTLSFGLTERIAKEIFN